MNELVPKTDAEAGTGKPPASPVATSAAANAPGIPPRGVDAKSSVPQFGGNPTGRNSAQFKFPVNTPEGQKERREADAERKRLRRANSEPPPLPSAVAPAPGAEQAPADNLSPGAPPSVAPVGTAPAIPWDPEQLKPLFDELIDGAEESRVLKFTKAAEAASLPARLVKEISTDAKYSPSMKRAISYTAPRVMADAANSLGISGKYSNVGVLVTAMVAERVRSSRLMARLEKLVAENKAQAATVTRPAPAEPL